jgi:hypothetical protein
MPLSFMQSGRSKPTGPINALFQYCGDRREFGGLFALREPSPVTSELVDDEAGNVDAIEALTEPGPRDAKLEINSRSWSIDAPPTRLTAHVSPSFLARHSVYLFFARLLAASGRNFPQSRSAGSLAPEQIGFCVKIDRHRKFAANLCGQKNTGRNAPFIHSTTFCYSHSSCEC